jgi:energy-coupling factor transporter ATP-binding protein EcfA2
MSDDFDFLELSTRPLKRLYRRKRMRETRKYNFSTKNDERKWTDEMTHKEREVELENFKGEVQNQYFLASTSLNDHYITKIIDMRSELNLNTMAWKEELVVNSKEWLNHIRNDYPNFQKIEFGSTTGMVIDNENLNFIDYSISSKSTQVNLYGSNEFVRSKLQQFHEIFQIAKCHIEWVYGGDGSSVNIPLMPEKLPISEMYPFLGDETLEQYYDRYLQSPSAILLLIGPPGTGKTTFIRGLLHHSSKNAIVTYDEKILERDFVFSRFIEDDADVMVIEDADNFLKSRTDGNTMMHRFLNVGDGLISVRGKKLIFSTNLPSIRDVDSALVRAGRCFDVVSFDDYTLEQAEKIAKKMNISFEPKDKKSDKYSLAEIFFKQKNSSPKQVVKMGF